MFQLPFEEIAAMIDRTPAAARQLASRARRRVKGVDVTEPELDRGRQREVVDAFFSAARGGDFDALVELLDPDVVLRVDAGASRRATSMVISGSAAVARQARAGLRTWLGRPSTTVRPALVNGGAGVVVLMDGEPVNVIGFTVVGRRIAEIDAMADPERLRTVLAAAFVDH
jgi:RNA polymerase sigma-70 factor (ECF subfamily)